jgi:hypothetical protein
MTTAWHFLPADRCLRWPLPGETKRRLIEPGSVVEFVGQLDMCAAGLHASVNLWDALEYAPGPVVCRVECGGAIIEGNDKLVCTQRRVLWMVDAEMALRDHARWCARRVMRLWTPPDVVVRYLQTGREDLRDAARGAAWNAARGAAWNAARDAARGAAWNAAGAAAGDAAWDAAGDAAGAAEISAQRDDLERRIMDLKPKEHV